MEINKNRKIVVNVTNSLNEKKVVIFFIILNVGTCSSSNRNSYLALIRIFNESEKTRFIKIDQELWLHIAKDGEIFEQKQKLLNCVD